MESLRLKTNYRCVPALQQFYTGGPFVVSSDGSFIACACGDSIKIVDSANSAIRSSLDGDSEQVTALALGPDDKLLFSSSHSRQIRVWDLSTLKRVRSWKSHDGPVMCMACDPSGGLLATGGADRKVLVWDVDGGYCTHCFKGHGGVVSCIMFHPDPEKQLLFSGSADGGDNATVRVWDISKTERKTCIATLDNHRSAVTSIAVSEDGWTLLSAGRDKVVTLWDLHDYSNKKTVITNEAVEAVCVVGAGSPFASSLNSYQQKSKKHAGSQALYFVTVGERGIVRVWSSEGAVCMFEQKISDITASTDEDGSRRGFTSAVMLGSDQGLLCVTADQQFLFYSLKCIEELLQLNLTKRLVGYNDSKSNECEDDGQVKKMEKKQLTEQSKLQEYDDTVEKTKTEKNLSKKNKQSGDEEHETNGGNPCLVKNNEREDDDQGKKLKKKKLSDESKHKEDNKFRNNVGEDADQGKKMKKKMKKKLSDESKHKKDNDFRNNVDEDGDIGKKKKKKKQSHKSKKNENCVLNSNEGEDGDQGNGGDQGENMKKRKKAKAVVGDSSNPADERASKRKRVTFSDQVEVCCDGLVRGKRFTPEEDEKIKASVYDYIESKGLGDEGLDMVLNCRKHREVRGCWKEIAEVIPYRPWYSVYQRAHVLFETVDSKWTPDELEFIRKNQKRLGSDWKTIAEGLGRGRHQVKDAWRNVKFTNAKRGNWSQEEYQNLFNLVNSDLRARALEDFRKVQHGMFRDNVSWEVVGTQLSTRSSAMCCMKWYNKLTSPMVASGEWCDTDDFRMINALYTLDACCMEEVDWDYLLEHRSGDVCRKRWGQMVQHIGEHAGKSFAEQVEILAKRFCPELLEAREAFDNKPVVC